MYSIQVDNTAWKIFKKLSPEVKKKLINQAQILKRNPLSGEPLKGKYREYRSLHSSFKGTAYRIIYQVFTKTSIIVIRLADKRENIYRRLEEMKRV